MPQDANRWRIVADRCPGAGIVDRSLADRCRSLSWDANRWRIVVRGGESFSDRWRIVADRCLKTRIVGAQEEYGKMSPQNLAAARSGARPGRFDCKFPGPVCSQSPGPVCEQNGPGDLLAKRPDPFASKTGLTSPEEALCACADRGIFSRRGWRPGADSKPAGSF